MNTPADTLLSNLPAELKERIHFGLYGSVEQYYISGVDGTCAQLGSTLPPVEDLPRIIETADANHKQVMRHKPRWT